MEEKLDPAVARPRHTTVAAGLIIGCSALALVGVVDQLGGLHSLETRHTLEDFLRRPPGSDLGLDLTSARSVLRGVLMVVAGCATAALVLGFGVLRRDARSRLALNVLALPLFVGGLITGGFWTSVVASASVFLWMGPSGDWFAGRTPTPRPVRPEPPAPAAQQPPTQSSAQPTTQASTQASTQTSYPPVAPAWQPPPAYTQSWAPMPQVRQRPTSVLTACVLAWSLSGLVIGLMSLTLAVVIASPDTLWREALRQQPQLAQQGLTRDEVFTAAQVAGFLGIVWALVAILLAALLFRGSNGARIALACSGYAAAAVCLVGTLSAPLMLLPLLVCATGASLALRPESRAWCRPPGS